MFDAVRACQIRIIVADEQPIFREGLKRVLASRSYAVVGESSEMLDALDLARDLRPDVLLLGESIEGENAWQSLEELGKIAPGVRTIVLAVRTDPQTVAIALRRGARAVLPRESSPHALFECIAYVLQNEYWLRGGRSA
jgi:DNA-binding NarL/FixJ family response regulator